MNNTELKALYTEARVDILLFKPEDVIATSNPSLNPDGSANKGDIGSWTPPEW